MKELIRTWVQRAAAKISQCPRDRMDLQIIDSPLGRNTIFRAYEPDGLPVHLVHAGQGTFPLKTRSFLDFAVARLRSALAALPAADAVSPS